MNDRELLELAAKATGITGDIETIMRGWNPLTDDGDALRLAVALARNGIHFSLLLKKFSASSQDCNGMPIIEEILLSGDLNAATRRAIVRAAAAIGKGMK